MLKLFNEETGYLIIDELAMERESYKKVIADNIITPDELREQAELVVSYLQRLDAKLDEEEKKLVTDLLCELAVLYELSSLAKE
ncbi:hypothetical protein [Ruminococcus gauvreauii]|uniref:Uncharacterized protein n=1 Tax=Ruminococcus gauvreauii TaxID=438033 RepID=A0ABY5VGX8_9FIRM|nr:hypothetical protein [Ruminococcus gauvreauii]UWP59416.1 hypothetical protein NQ502_18990 [Ruminococcus gauvreauii]